MSTASEAVISAVNLHAWMFIIMKRTARHPVPSNLKTVVFGNLSGCYMVFNVLKNLKDYSKNDNECPAMDIIDYIIDRYISGEFGTIQYYENYISNNTWFKELKELIIKTKMTDLSLNNFGIVNRDGKPMIVIIDSGLNHSIFTSYYKELIQDFF